VLGLAISGVPGLVGIVHAPGNTVPALHLVIVIAIISYRED